MSQQIQITGGAKVRDLQDVIIGSSGVLSSLGFNVANGVPQLDSNGKILVSQLPNSVMEYKGTWNVVTNTPYLVNGVGNQGDVYLVEGAATTGTSHDFGAGAITFYNGDQAIYSGSIWQRASGATGSVTSVGLSTNGGAITISNSPITTSGTIAFNFNGTSGQYVNGAGNLVTFPTTIAQAQRLITEVYNETGATLTKGTVVYINGGHGNLPTVTKAIATGDATSAQTYGVVQTDITDNNNGYVVVLGSLGDLDTQAYPNGTQLYLSSTTAGAWTSTKQYAPAHLVYVGIVVRSHPTQGVVEIRIQNGFELDELHNVSAQTPSNNQGLFYNSSTQLWENKSIATALGYTPANDALVVHLAGTETITGAKTFSGYTTFTSTVELTSGLTFNNSGFTLLLQPPTLGVNRTVTLPNGTGTLALTSDISYPVTSVFGRTGAVVATEGDYSLTQLSDVTITTPSSGQVLRYNGTSWENSTESYVGTVTSVGLSAPTGFSVSGSPVTSSGTLALAFAAGYSLPTNASQTNWDTAYTNRITSATAPLSITSNVISISQASGSTNGYLSSTDWTTFNNKQATITLTTTGSSGAATLVGATLNIPNYGSALSGYLPLTGGTLTGALNINVSSGTALNVAGNAIFRGDTGVATPRQLVIQSGGSTPVYLEAKGYGANYITDFGIRTYNNVGTAFEVFYADSSGRVGINQVSPSYQLDVNGTGRFSGALSVGGNQTFTGVVGITRYIITDETSTGTGKLVIQAGAGSGAWGGAINLYAASNATHTGDVAIGLSATTGAKFRVNSSGLDAGTDLLTIERTGAATFSSSVSGTSIRSSGVGTFGFNTVNNGEFQIYATAADGMVMAGRGSSYDMIIANSSGGDVFRIPTGTTTANFVGNVGIGTSSPSVTLNVVGNARFEAASGNRYLEMISSTSSVQFGTDGTTQFIYGSGAFPLAFSTNGTERMRITSGGNVGIGTSSPTTFSGFLTVEQNNASGNSIHLVTGTSVIYQTIASNTNSAVYIGSRSNHPLLFTTNDTERMRITSGGNVLIGTTSDAGYKLYVDGGSSNGMAFYSTSPGNQFKIAGSAAAMTFSNTISGPSMGGSLGVATSAGDFLSGTAAGDTIFINQFSGKRLYAVSYSGGVYLSSGATSWTANSDIRLKNINSYIENAVEKLSTLQTINFSYKDDKTNKQNLGLIAQEVEKIFPELIDKNGDGMLGVRYTELVPVLIKAVQELKLEIETLKNK